MTPAKPFAVALGLLGLVLILMRDALFLGRAYFERDLLSIYAPAAEAFVRAIAEGALPLRDPSTAFGQPLLGNPDAQILYPPTWLNLVALPESAYPLIVLIHYCLGAAGAAALAWRFSRSNIASFFAGAFWLVSGPLQSFLGVWHHFAGAAWMPWVLTAFDRLLEQTDRRRTLILGGAFGLQILAGSPDMCAMTMSLVLLRLVCGARESPRSRTLAQFGAALVALCVAALLGAGVWMTAGEISRASLRASMPKEVGGYWSVHPALSTEFIMPLSLGSLDLNQDTKDALYEGREPFVRSLYLGPLILPLFLAALASPGVAVSFRTFGAVGVAVSVILSFGKYTGAYGLITTLLPVLAIFRYPSKLVIPASLLLCVLAGVGLAHLKGERERRVAASTALLLIALHAAALFWTPIVLPQWVNSADVVVQRLLVRHVGTEIAFATAALLFFVASLAFHRRPRALILAASIGFAAALAVNSNINQTVPRSVLRFRPDQVLTALASGKPARLYVSDYVFSSERSEVFLGRASPFEGMKADGLPKAVATIVAYRSLLVPPVGGAWGIEYAWDTDLRGLFQVALRDLTGMVGGLEGTPAFLRMLQIANVSHVVALHTSTFGQLQLERTLAAPVREPLYVFRVPEPLPRAYAVSGVRVLTNGEAASGILDPRFSPTAEVILEGGTPSAVSATFKSTVVIASRRSDRIVLDATLNEPGAVVLLEGFLPGWRATVDGLPVPVRRANALFVAVPVPAGRHNVVFAFRPWTAMVGLSLTALTAIALLISLARPLNAPRIKHKDDEQ